ncbi:hypothetical protein ACFFJQ_04375 [Bacillus capparidis]|uniref:IS30 family transposase n=1 Tax=Bacillus capparidis TaxID=1840411 RepID=A0ABS4CXA9_9BACI|nr:hypothetical protein [Bacillus capparidis]MBP1081402.1 IS30 family transposase [Bacillus capparidis]MED1096074.1 hypothetical protein [Bacillus capparidis]
MRTYKHWTSKEINRLMDMRERLGMTYRAIATVLNRPSISVEKRYRKQKGHYSDAGQ